LRLRTREKEVRDSTESKNRVSAVVLNEFWHAEGILSKAEGKNRVTAAMLNELWYAERVLIKAEGKNRVTAAMLNELWYAERVLIKAQGREVWRAHPGEWTCIHFNPERVVIAENLMPQSLAQIYLHIIFSTKERRPLLQKTPILEEAFRLLGGICKNHDCPVLRVGGVADHAHILCRSGRTISVSDLIKELKRESSQQLKTKSPELHDFHWQNGYGAFSVSPGHVEALLEYIANQQEHHKRETFQEEFLRLLTIYGLKWDERYLWD
jgi:putative transposase